MHLTPHKNPLRGSNIKSASEKTRGEFLDNRTFLFILLVFSVALSFLVSRYISGKFIDLDIKIVTGLIAIVFFVFFSLIRIVSLHHKNTNSFFLDIARALNFTYTRTAGIDTVSGEVFSDSNQNRRIRNVLTGTHEGYPVRIFTYTYDKGENNSKINHTFFEVTLPFFVPHLSATNIRDIAKIKFFGFKGTSIYPNKISNIWNDEKVSFEGNFSDHYVVYTQPDMQTEARQVFTPEVMSYLMKLPTAFNIEACGGKLYIYDFTVCHNTKKLADFIDTADMFLDIFAPLLESISRSSEEVDKRHQK